MTTVAYRGGIMAADKRAMSDGWIVSETAIKLRRLDDGSVAGFSTTAAFWVERWVSWYNDPREQEQLDLKNECLVLHARSGGRLTLYSGTGFQDLSHEPFRAIGSGYPAARSAFLMGADAETAVRIVSQMDPCTGPAVEVMRVDG